MSTSATIQLKILARVLDVMVWYFNSYSLRLESLVPFTPSRLPIRLFFFFFSSSSATHALNNVSQRVGPKERETRKRATKQKQKNVREDSTYSSSWNAEIRDDQKREPKTGEGYRNWLRLLCAMPSRPASLHSAARARSFALRLVRSRHYTLYKVLALWKLR